MRAIVNSHGEHDLAVVAALEIAVGRGERVLHGVLGLLAQAEHVAAEGQDPRTVAFEGDLEGRVAAAPDLGNEAIVAGEAQQAPEPGAPGACTSTWAALPARTLSAGRGSLITREPASSSGVEGMKTFLIAVLGCCARPTRRGRGEA